MTRGHPSLFIWCASVSLLLLCLGAPAPGEPVGAEPEKPNDPLVQELDALLSHSSIRGTQLGISVLDCSTGESVYERNPDMLLNPASNLKLLTSSAALDVLGPAFSFPTELLTDGAFEDGVITGDLYVKGRGDPLMVYEAVWKIIKNLQARGLTEIQGNLIADDSYFDSIRVIPDWDRESRDEEAFAYDAPLGALSVNFNAIAIVVRPGKEARSPAQVALETPTGYVKIRNEATTGAARSRSTLKFSRGPRSRWQELLVLEGQVPLGSRPRTYYRTVEDPPAFALTLFSEMMKKEGISLKGGLRKGTAPETCELVYRHFSEPLGIALRYMNKLSSNFIAEQVLKTMGAEVYDVPGTTANGLKVVRDYLSRTGLQWDGAEFYNGSGLSGRTRITARQISSLLCYVHQDSNKAPDFFSTLPIAGVDGTMRRRMRGTLAEDNLRAKTGSVRGVFGFSGLVRSADGQDLGFSFIVNEIEGRVSRIKEVQDRWAVRLIAGPAKPEGAQ